MSQEVRSSLTYPSIHTLQAAYRSITKRSKGVYIQTLIQMPEPCLRMCEILFRMFRDNLDFLIVNNVEIDLILQSYIKIWYTEPSKSYVPCAKLLNYYPFKLQGIIRMYFQDTDIYYDDYFQFVCLFLFFDVDRLILLFLSLTQIHSNIFITSRQLARFVNGFYLNNDSFSNVISVLSSQGTNAALTETKDAFYLKEFIKYLKGSDYFNSMIEEIKVKLSTTVLNPTIYNNIKMRLEYFYINPENVNRPIPSENCKNKILRILFTNNPPPFRFDYCVSIPDSRLFDEMIYSLRQGHGYGNRKSSRISSNLNITPKSVLMKKQSLKASHNSLSSTCPTTTNSTSTSPNENNNNNINNNSLYKQTINNSNYLTNLHTGSKRNLFLSPSGSPMTTMSFKRTIHVVHNNSDHNI